MQAALTDHPWTMEELLRAMAFIANQLPTLLLPKTHDGGR
jgi:hypothetical protein